MEDFAKRLNFFRSLRGMSQGDVAEKVGVSRKQVSDYEVGSTKPRKQTFIKILDALGVTELEFLSSDCMFNGSGSGSGNGAFVQQGTTMGAILASPLRGKLINISGMELDSPYRSPIKINIYSGTLTRTKQVDENYVNVYYLTGDKEECIFVHNDGIEPILKSMEG